MVPPISVVFVPFYSSHTLRIFVFRRRSEFGVEANEEERLCLVTSVCVTCWKPAPISGTRPGAGTPKCGRTSTVPRTGSTLSTCRRPIRCCARRWPMSPASQPAATRCSSSAPSIKPGKWSPTKPFDRACPTWRIVGWEECSPTTRPSRSQSSPSTTLTPCWQKDPWNGYRRKRCSAWRRSVRNSCRIWQAFAR